MAQTFVYKVRDMLGNAHSGVIEADSRELVIDKLRQSGYLVTRVEARVKAPTVGESFAGWKPVNVKDLSILCRQFATMIGAGIPLLKCLSILMEQTTKVKLTQALEDVRRDIESGSTLSTAFGKHDKIFPNIMIAMIRAGETGGILDEVLDRLADHFENDFELKEKIKTATRYPMVVMGLAVVVIIIMMAFVLPTFGKILSSMNVEMPLPTKVLMAASNFTKNNILLILTTLVFFAYGGWRYIKSPEGKKNLDKLLFKIPIIKGIVSKIATARLCRTLGTLVHAGVPIIQAIEVSEATADNYVIMEGLVRAKISIREGEGLAGPLESTGVFSPMVTQMIAVGEESGNLDVMLKKVADFYDKEVKYVVENLSTLIEPLLIIFMGGIIGGMIVSILLPMLKVYESVGNM